MNYQIEMQVNGEYIRTLRDILPDKGPMRLLFIGKRPSPESVSIGHYFRGNQGLVFWQRLREYSILDFKDDEYPDPDFNERLYNTNIFVFPMHGTPCTSIEAHKALIDLKQFLNT